eukprot:1186573-Prorocentrum_minimum.AAC.1
MLGAEAPPLGLIHSAVGGTMIEAWSANASLANCSVTPPGHCDAAQQCDDCGLRASRPLGTSPLLRCVDLSLKVPYPAGVITVSHFGFFLVVYSVTIVSRQQVATDPYKTCGGLFNAMVAPFTHVTLKVGLCHRQASISLLRVLKSGSNQAREHGMAARNTHMCE